MDEPPYSQVRTAGNLLFVSGQLGDDAERVLASGIVAQTSRALADVESAFSESDAKRTDNEPCCAFFGDAPLPARSAIGVHLPDDVLVEIEAVAILRRV
jgi:enamine deaminase RidA (YjgF/YER057c/UK114 family)